MKSGLLSGAALSALLAFSAPAAAQDTDAFLDRLQAAMAEQGTIMSWADVEEYENDDGRPVIALTDVTAGMGGEDAELELVELIEVSETDGGGWRIGTLFVPEYSNQDGENHVHLSDMSLDNVVIEPEGEENAWGGTMFYDGVTLGGMTVTVKDTEVFTMNDLAIEIDVPDGAPMTFDGAAEAFTADLSAAEDPKARAAIAALGYEQISGHFVIEGDWDPAEGRIALSRYDITVDDAGTIGISLELGGYTPEFAKSLREMQADMAANPGGDDSARGLAMMGMMQQLTFRSARIHFQDDTLTEKVLEFVAQQQGARSTDVANQAKAMVPFMMMQLGDQQLTTQATTAVSAFLDDPGNLVITAQPASPVPFALLMAGAMSAPQSLPQTLGVGIAANE